MKEESSSKEIALINNQVTLTLSPSAEISPINWRKEISDGLLWLHERSWSVGGIILSLAVLCMYHYASYWNVSLSISSPALITALPIMFVLIAFAGITLGLSLLLPIIVLFTPLRKNAPQLYHFFLTDKEDIGSSMRPGPIIFWVGGSMIATALLLLLLVLLPQAWMAYGKAISLSIIVVFIASTITGLWFLIRKSDHNISFTAISGEFKLLLVFATTVQFLWVLSCLEIAANLVPNVGVSYPVLQALGIAMLVIGILSLFQLCGARLIAYFKKHRAPFKTVVFVVISILTIMLLIPPLGASLAAFAFQSSASGGRGCTVLLWSDSAGADINPLREGHKQEISKPLRVLLDSNNIYQVRLKGEKNEVRFVPHSSVIGFVECPSSAGTDASDDD